MLVNLNMLMRDKLKDIFTEDEFDSLEYAFEAVKFSWNKTRDYSKEAAFFKQFPPKLQPQDSYDQFEHSDRLMRAILTNMVENGGTFKP